MKFILTILLSFSLNCLLSQTVDSTTMIEFVRPIEVLPEWKNGTNKELIEVITSIIKYPNEQCIEGITILQFMVDTLGHVSDPRIVRSISEKIDSQLLNIICNYEFRPGILIDKKVDFVLNLPIKIKLE